MKIGLKHVIGGILIVFLVVTISGCTNNGSGAYSGPTKTYSGNGVTFNYPESWQVNDTGGLMGIQVYDPKDEYKTNMITITFGSELGEVNANNYLNNLSSLYVNTTFEQEVNSSNEEAGSDLIFQKDLTINGMRVHETIFNAGNTKTIKVVLELKPSQIYIFGASSASEDFETLKSYVYGIVNSFKVQ